MNSIMPEALHILGRPWHARRVTDRGNGEDPFPVNPVQRRAPLRLVPIDEEAPLLESVKKLASHVLALGERFNVMDRDLVALGAQMLEGFVRIETRMSLPPVRPELGSGHALVEEAGSQLIDRFKKKAAETPGSNVQATPEELARMAQEVFAEETRKLEEKRRLQKLEKDEKDRDAAADRARDTRRQTLILTVSGIIVAAVTILLTALAARSSGHDQGFAEGVRVAPTNTVVVPVATSMAATETLSASSVPPFPPASSVPPKRAH
jgi:hypothetical protein